MTPPISLLAAVMPTTASRRRLTAFAAGLATFAAASSLAVAQAPAPDPLIARVNGVEIHQSLRVMPLVPVCLGSLRACLQARGVVGENSSELGDGAVVFSRAEQAHANLKPRRSILSRKWFRKRHSI